METDKDMSDLPMQDDEDGGAGMMEKSLGEGGMLPGMLPGTGVPGGVPGAPMSLALVKKRRPRLRIGMGEWVSPLLCNLDYYVKIHFLKCSEISVNL